MLVNGFSLLQNNVLLRGPCHCLSLVDGAGLRFVLFFGGGGVVCQSGVFYLNVLIIINQY